MPYACAVKTCGNKAKRGTSLSFHRLPVREPERLKLWLLALDIDMSTPLEELKKCIVCSEHFVMGDYTTIGQPKGMVHRFLRPTAVPTIGLYPLSPEQRQPEVDSENEESGHTFMDPLSPEDTKPDPREFPSSMQQFDNEVERRSILEGTRMLTQDREVQSQLSSFDLEQAPIQEETEIKEEQIDQCISPDMEASRSVEVRHMEPESTLTHELPSSPSAVTLNDGTDDKWNESDGSLSPHQSPGIEVFVDLEQPPRDEKSCYICGKRFRKDSFLIRHVQKSHKKQKAFKCLECNKEFDQRYKLVLHVRIHTGEKPFTCEYCGKAFGQNSSRLAHLRVHTGEKPYFCAKCGKSFATSNHLKFCKVQNAPNIVPEKEITDEGDKEEKAFKCFQCNKEFDKNHQLVRHMRVHSGDRPFSCDFCGKTFTQNSNRTVHMRQHTGEKPYFCEKCGKRFASSHHLKSCTGKPRKNSSKKFRCATCGRRFHTESNLKVHMEVHRSWQQHINKKLQGHELEAKKLPEKTLESLTPDTFPKVD
ncbi:zinc finger protein 287-like [Echeneis naucrates]|uniref:Zinc finger protein 287-like n=1 Tax=Echeneis naucrates TaxID=173247 RepID=A0A665TF17_ECHNA|nr:zinc finger protein 287-like [Echeneis naucrates]